MSPRYPSTDPRVIRAALEYASSHSKNATARHFAINHHSIQRWVDYRTQLGPAWPTDEDIAAWDATVERRARVRREKYRYIRRLHRNGGRPLMLPQHGTIRRLQALCAIGWTQQDIGARLGLSRSRVSQIIQTTRQGVRPETAKKVADLYDELWDVIPVGPAANRARADAARKQWVSALAWDDDVIDDPEAKPVGVGEQDIAGYDETRIERRIAGDRTVRLHKGETAEVVRRLVADGWSLNAIRRHTGVKPERYITRDTEELAA